jgi:steroid delta-isomerase-like uncharacterized protein
MSKDLRATINRSKEMWNTGNLNIVDEIYAKNFVNHYPFDPSVRDLDSFKKFVTECRKGMPNLSVTIEDMIAEGDKLACRWVCSGTHEVDFFGIAATGKKATWTGVTIYRFDSSGKIVEAWWSEDALGMLQQLGVIPTE